MNKEILKEVIKEFQEGELPEVVEREIDVPLSSSKIISIVGPRRSGKTYFLFVIIKRLFSQGISKDKIIYLSFDDPRLLPCDAKGMELILEAYRELFPEHMKKTSYLFLDEIQNVKDWELGLRRIHDTRKFRIFVTGSSSKLLSKEIATQLRGRAISFEILPFSFREFLSARDIKLDKNIIYSTKRFFIKKYLEEYLETGGFPEVVLEEKPDLKLRILKEYVETMFIRDLVERYNIKNQPLLRELIKFHTTNIASIFSVNAFYKWIKQTYPVTKRTLLNYVSYLEDSGLFFLVRKFSYSLKEQAQGVRKCYIVDNGLRNAYGFRFSEDKGRNLENVVFLELCHRKIMSPLMEIFYWQDYRKREVDFVIKEGKEVKELIQACAVIDDLNIRKREIKALLKTSEDLKCNNLSVITLDYEDEEIIHDKRIIFKPLWKWLIEDSQTKKQDIT